MDSIELSVIIPAYNAGRTIGRCLDLLLQSIQQASVESSLPLRLSIMAMISLI